MTLNDSIRYTDGILSCDEVPLTALAAEIGTPTYVYSRARILANYQGIKTAFAALNAHIHYSAKANANLSILHTLIQAGAGIDAVSAGEIHRALTAGASPANIVFAGVGKTPEELRYAVAQGVGWFNVENVAELPYLDDAAAENGAGRGDKTVRVALRLNPEVTANTHPYIATGHGGAKFGLTAEVIRDVLAHQADYPHLKFAGIHVHIGSQLHDVEATTQAVRNAVDLIAPYPQIRTVNVGGGLPVAYRPDEPLPDFNAFAEALHPLLHDYEVLLEPGRSIIADTGLLLARVLYVKQQAGKTIVITDGSMAELLRPALYQAHHEIVAMQQHEGEPQPVSIVGPVCETADVLGTEVLLPPVQSGDLLAVLTAGAYGMVMASNYNARTRPAEVMVTGNSYEVIRRRETWDDLLQLEL